MHVIRIEKALNDRSPTVRGLAIELVTDYELDDMLPEITRMLNDRDSEVRALAIESIAKLAKRDFPIKTIIKRLFDDDELVRVAAAEALAEFGDAAVLSGLYKALKDKSPLVRSFVAEAIGSIGDKRSIANLEKCLRRETDERAKLGFYVGLSNLDSRNVLQNLIDLYQSEDYRVRSAIINSLDQIKFKGKTVEKINLFLKDALVNEKTIAVKSSIENALKLFRN